ncbi:MAG: hypothetical protein JWM82_70 [Myxococcales bacterium]|nr:hypothetical protein [Myxococcales bacterium]
MAGQIDANDYVRAVYGRARRRRRAQRRNAAGVAVLLAMAVVFGTYRATSGARHSFESTRPPSQLFTPNPSLSPVPTGRTTPPPPPTPSTSQRTTTPTPAPGSFTLPDGTRLPAACPVPALQATFPSGDESFLAHDGCGSGQYSLATGKIIRYVAASFVSMAANGDIYVTGGPVCGPARPIVRRLAAGSERFETLDIAHGSPGSSALVIVPQTCDQRPETPDVWVYGQAARHLTFEGPAGSVPSAGNYAVDIHGRVVVGLAYVSYANCAPGQGGACSQVLAEGLAVAGATDTHIGPPTMMPGTGCRFTSVAWSGDHVLVVERCDTNSGTTSRLVTLNPSTSARLATVALPELGDIAGIRALTNGDALVVTYGVKDATLIRVSGTRVSATPLPHRCGACGGTPLSVAP